MIAFAQQSLKHRANRRHPGSEANRTVALFHLSDFVLPKIFFLLLFIYINLFYINFSYIFFFIRRLNVLFLNSALRHPHERVYPFLKLLKSPCHLLPQEQRALATISPFSLRLTSVIVSLSNWQPIRVCKSIRGLTTFTLYTPNFCFLISS